MMKQMIHCALLVVGTLLSAQAQGTVAEQAMAFTFGASDATIQAVYDEVAATPANGYPALEARVLAAVKAQPKLSPEAVKLTSDVLRLTGSTACLPLLTEWLKSAETAPAALRALSGISGKEVDQTLLGVLKTADGEIRIGALNALAARGNAEVVPFAKTWASGADEALAVASAVALGRLGSAEALAALKALKPASVALGRARTDALIACAGRLKAKPAAALYRSLLAGEEPQELKAAALACLVALDPAAALPDVVSLLKGQDLYLARLAAGHASKIKGSAASKTLTAALAGLPTDVQLALVTSLGLLVPDDVARLKNVIQALSNRACTEATPKLLALAKGDNAEVRLTALRGLRGTATPAAFPELVAMLPKASADDLAAIVAAMWIAAGDAETYGLRFMKVWQPVEGASPALRIAVLSLAARASEPEALEVVKKQMADSDKGVAAAAQRALFSWQNETCVSFCMELAKTTTDKRIKSQALETVAGRLERRDVKLDKKQRLAILDEALALNPEANARKRIEKAIEAIKK